LRNVVKFKNHPDDVVNDDAKLAEYGCLNMDIYMEFANIAQALYDLEEVETTFDKTKAISQVHTRRPTPRNTTTAA
jgi:hypothetical protein